MSADVRLEISEGPGGWPGKGDLVYATDSDTAYRITDDGIWIGAYGSGQPNTCVMTGREVGSSGDLDDEDWDGIVECGVEEVGE